MTKEELEKEADEYAKKDCPDNFLCTRNIAKRAYLASAEPREKCIRKAKDLIRRLITIYRDQIEYDDRHILLEYDKFESILEEVNQFLEGE